MKILIISRVAWNSSTNFGNTYTSIFKNMPDVEIAHVYFGSGLPDTDIASRFYRVTERDVVNSLLRRQKKCGQIVESKKASEITVSRIRKFSQNHRYTVFFAARDLLWSSNKWKNDELVKFVESFGPDLIFAPLYHNIYMNKIQQSIARIANVPIVSFVTDDIYSLRQFHFSPFYWIYRLCARRSIRKTLKNCKTLYTISQMQCDEYTKTLHHNCKVLYKGALFGETPKNCPIHSPIKIVFTGNLSSGRWKTVSKLANAIKTVNNGKDLFILEIYSLTALTSKMRKAIEIPGCSVFKGSVSGTEINDIQNNSDILLHCENFNLKDKLEVRLSFSTKIVDYFKRAKCILAIGPDDVASIKYLRDNDAAIIADSEDKLVSILQNIAHHPEIISQYGNKAWNCGVLNHQIDQIQSGLYQELLSNLKGTSNENIAN